MTFFISDGIMPTGSAVIGDEIDYEQNFTVLGTRPLGLAGKPANFISVPGTVFTP